MPKEKRLGEEIVKRLARVIDRLPSDSGLVAEKAPETIQAATLIQAARQLRCDSHSLQDEAMRGVFLCTAIGLEIAAKHYEQR